MQSVGFFNKIYTSVFGKNDSKPLIIHKSVLCNDVTSVIFSYLGPKELLALRLTSKPFASKVDSLVPETKLLKMIKKEFGSIVSGAEHKVFSTSMGTWGIYTDVGFYVKMVNRSGNHSFARFGSGRLGEFNEFNLLGKLKLITCAVACATGITTISTIESLFYNLFQQNKVFAVQLRVDNVNGTYYLSNVKVTQEEYCKSHNVAHNVEPSPLLKNSERRINDWIQSYKIKL